MVYKHQLQLPHLKLKKISNYDYLTDESLGNNVEHSEHIYFSGKVVAITETLLLSEFCVTVLQFKGLGVYHQVRWDLFIQFRKKMHVDKNAYLCIYMFSKITYCIILFLILVHFWSTLTTSNFLCICFKSYKLLNRGIRTKRDDFHYTLFLPKCNLILHKNCALHITVLPITEWERNCVNVCF